VGLEEVAMRKDLFVIGRYAGSCTAWKPEEKPRGGEESEAEAVVAGADDSIASA
jgi:hypothetical protein